MKRKLAIRNHVYFLLASLLMMIPALPAWAADKESDEETLRNATTVLQAMVGQRPLCLVSAAQPLAFRSVAHRAISSFWSWRRRR